MTPSIPAFPNKINDLGDFRGGSKLRAILQSAAIPQALSPAAWISPKTSGLKLASVLQPP